MHKAQLFPHSARIHMGSISSSHFNSRLGQLSKVGWLEPGSLAVGILFGIVGLGLSIALSIASYHLVEVKFLRLKRRFTYVENAPRTL